MQKTPPQFANNNVIKPTPEQRADLLAFVAEHYRAGRSLCERNAHDAADVFLQIVSSRNEDDSLVLTPNRPFSAQGDAFGRQAVTAR